MMEDYIGVGLIWGNVITSGPYGYVMSKLRLEDRYMDCYCALCTGTWLGLIFGFSTTPDLLGIASVPIVAEATARWIGR